MVVCFGVWDVDRLGECLAYVWILQSVEFLFSGLRYDMMLFWGYSVLKRFT